MEPIRERNATLVDLLDRVLDKGVVLHADVIVSVAGIPLIGVTLRAALAGMETMRQYGLMENWDKSIRAREPRRTAAQMRDLLQGRTILLESLGALYHEAGIYRSWRYGRFYLTADSLLLYHQEYDEVLLNVSLDRIKGLSVRTESASTGESRDILYMLLEDGTAHRLRCREVKVLKEEISARAGANGIFSRHGVKVPVELDLPGNCLSAGEDVSHSGSMWHLCPDNAPGGVLGSTWRPGKLYVSDRRLCWEHQTESRLKLEIPMDSVRGCNRDEQNNSMFKRKTPILDLIYEADSAKQVVSFSGEAVKEWQAAIEGAIRNNRHPPVRENESCPGCGKLSNIQQLLDAGCPHCDWLSARMQRKALGVPV